MILAAVLALAAPTVAEMKWRRRVLIVTAPREDGAALKAQRNSLAGWRGAATDRDVSVVEVIGDRVKGARDTAAKLRARYRLDPRRFALVLIGKDGNVALRSREPVPAKQLQGTIDAMPMRRAGQR